MSPSGMVETPRLQGQGGLVLISHIIPGKIYKTRTILLLVGLKTTFSISGLRLLTNLSLKSHASMEWLSNRS